MGGARREEEQDDLQSFEAGSATSEGGFSEGIGRRRSLDGQVFAQQPPFGFGHDGAAPPLTDAAGLAGGGAAPTEASDRGSVEDQHEDDRHSVAFSDLAYSDAGGEAGEGEPAPAGRFWGAGSNASEGGSSYAGEGGAAGAGEPAHAAAEGYAPLGAAQAGRGWGASSNASEGGSSYTGEARAARGWGASSNASDGGGSLAGSVGVTGAPAS